MEFFIKIRYQNRNYSFKVVQLPVDSRSEYFVVIAANKILILESNRPLFRSKGLMHRIPNFKLVYGKLEYESALDELVPAIMKEVEKVGSK